MRAAQLAELVDGEPAGVGSALEVVAGFDEALVAGLARPDDARAAALTGLAGALAGTPLGEPVAEAAAKVTAGSVGEEHLMALAGGRTAVLGAVHDALLSRLDAALGRARAPWSAQTGPAPEVADTLLAGCRSWLAELAITGWRGVDHALVSGAAQVIEALLATPPARRLAVLLDGLAAELRAWSPVATMQRLPERRWGDLWARALLLAHHGGWPPGGGQVSGRLLPLGVDLHSHGTAVQLQVHGVLEPAGGSPRLVRTSLVAAKTDTIVGPAVWRLFAEYPKLLGALAERRCLELTGVPLLDSGDLLWREHSAQIGAPADPFATAQVHLADALAPATPPLDRHPVHIGEPVLLDGYTVVDGTIRLGDNELALDLDRLPSAGPLTPALVTASAAGIGLLRWDAGRWSLQPLAVRTATKRATIEAHNGDWALGITDPKVAKADAKTGDAVAVLRERAGRLLRR